MVGERTWGKGTVQNVVELESGHSALKLTTAKYWRPSGRDIHRDADEDEEDQWGVQPDSGFDIQLSEEEFEQTLEARRQRDVLRGVEDPTPPTPASPADRQLQRAIEYLLQGSSVTDIAPAPTETSPQTQVSDAEKDAPPADVFE